MLYHAEVVEHTFHHTWVHSTIRLVSNHETSKEKRSVLIQRGVVAKPNLPIDQHPYLCFVLGPELVLHKLSTGLPDPTITPSITRATAPIPNLSGHDEC